MGQSFDQAIDLPSSLHPSLPISSPPRHSSLQLCLALAEPVADRATVALSAGVDNGSFCRCVFAGLARVGSKAVLENT